MEAENNVSLDTFSNSLTQSRDAQVEMNYILYGQGDSIIAIDEQNRQIATEIRTGERRILEMEYRLYC